MVGAERLLYVLICECVQIDRGALEDEGVVHAEVHRGSAPRRVARGRDVEGPVPVGIADGVRAIPVPPVLMSLGNGNRDGPSRGAADESGDTPRPTRVTANWRMGELPPGSFARGESGPEHAGAIIPAPRLQRLRGA